MKIDKKNSSNCSEHTKKKSKEENQTCYTCDYRQSIPGDCHSRCNRKFEGITEPDYARNQWTASFPANFDPAWFTFPCAGFGEVAEESKCRGGDMFSDMELVSRRLFR